MDWFGNLGKMMKNKKPSEIPTFVVTIFLETEINK